MEVRTSGVLEAEGNTNQASTTVVVPHDGRGH